MATAQKKTAQDFDVTASRLIHASRERVFKAWTDRDQFARWWGPKGFTNPLCEIDVRPGGKMRIDMRAPDGAVYPMDGVYHEVVSPERIAFTGRAFDAKTGKTLIEDYNLVTFAEEGGKTRITVQVRILELAPEFAAAAAGMETGWSQSFQRLAGLPSMH